MTLLLLFLAYAIVLSAALWRAGHHSQAASSSTAPRKEPARILIVGATGGTGRQLVAQALERGYAVTAFARDPSKLRVSHPQLRVIQGDVLDESSVNTAMLGQDAVLSALGRETHAKHEVEPGELLMHCEIQRA
jgi:putative NADH-flavin reductase